MANTVGGNAISGSAFAYDVVPVTRRRIIRYLPGYLACKESAELAYATVASHDLTIDNHKETVIPDYFVPDKAVMHLPTEAVAKLLTTALGDTQSELQQGFGTRYFETSVPKVQTDLHRQGEL